jgi:hypothetical protein
MDTVSIISSPITSLAMPTHILLMVFLLLTNIMHTTIMDTMNCGIAARKTVHTNASIRQITMLLDNLYLQHHTAKDSIKAIPPPQT